MERLITRTDLRPALAAALLLLAAGCAHAIPRPAPRVAPNLEQAGLEEIVRRAAPPEDAVVFLVGEFLAERRIHEGLAYFRARRAEFPASPIFLALEGFFQVQLAPEVGLLSRVAHVEDALAKMDRAVAQAPRSPARLFRALVLARLPARFGRQAEAVRELELLTSPRSGLPLIAYRDAHLALAQALAAVGRHGESRAALRRSGYAELSGEPVALRTQFAVSRQSGTRYHPENFVEEAPGVYAAYGHDFAELYFVVTDSGVVAIDAGSTPARVTRVLELLRRRTSLPITHVILTHAHWDHAGGLAALAGPGTRVIASARYRETLAAIAHFDPNKAPAFLGAGGHTPRNLRVDQEIGAPATVRLGGVDFVLTPIEGGETTDSLLIEVPARNVVFAGDLVTNIGVPFIDEGSPEGFLRGMAALDRLPVDARVLHGHKPAGELFTRARLRPLHAAFSQLRALALVDLGDGYGAAEIVRRRGLVPAVRQSPEIAVTYFIFREAFLLRLAKEHAGHWTVRGDGLEPLTRRELATAIDGVAQGDPARFAVAGERLLARGDAALARELAELGLSAHPRDRALKALRRRALLALFERNQRWDFFKLTVYADLAGITLPPILPAPPATAGRRQVSRARPVP